MTSQIRSDNAEMEYLTAPFKVSRIALGTWAIGGWMWGGTDEHESIQTIHAALDRGINLIDTAPRGRRPQQQHHHQRSPRTPELHRRPQPDFSTAQPSTSPSCGQQPLHRPGGSSRSVRSRVAPIAGRSADRRRWLGAPLAFSPNARPHHLRPEPDSSQKNSIKRNGDVGSSRAPRAPARGDSAPLR